jgi:4-hydroxybenzoate polyprenyltransferase
VDVITENVSYQKRHAIAGIVLFWTILIGVFILLAQHATGIKPWGAVAVSCLFPIVQLSTVLWASPRKYRTISQLFTSSALLGFVLFSVIVFSMMTHRGNETNERYLILSSLMIMAISFIYGCGITGMLMFYAFADIKENPFYNFLSRN